MQSAPNCLAMIGLASSVALGGATLMDQIGPNDGSSEVANGGLASQYFEAAFSIYDIAAVDDFDNASGLSGSSLSMVLTFSTGSADLVSGAQINFYSSEIAASLDLVGDVASEDYVGTPSVNADWAGALGSTMFDFQATGFWPLNSGMNYASAIPVNEFSANGQTFTSASTIGDNNCWQANPAGGFGFGAIQVQPANLMYRINGGSGNPCDLPLSTECSADVSGPDDAPDGVVDVNDVLKIIATYGNVGDGTFRPQGDCTPLPNGDCQVDVNDLLACIEQFGTDCAPRGGCCFGVDGCIADETEANCGDAGGDWLGEGSNCDTCVSGACCLADSTCIQAVPEDCFSTGGAYQGDGTPCGNCPAVPANNDCANAQVVSSGFVAFDNTGATTTGSAIDPCGDIGEARQIYQDLWYSITATESGTLTVSTCDATTLDTVIAVYESCGGNAISCNDDFEDCANFTSLLTVPNVSNGDTFLVRIGSFAYGDTAAFDAFIEIAPEVEGACCISTTDCVELTPTDCTAFGGTYETGDCATVSCGWAGCQSGDTPEGVPCAEDTDAAGAAADPNGGLNSNPASYGSISINETICGSASTFTCLGCADDGTDLTYRDTDWYLFDNLDGGTYTITVGGEGPLLFGIVDLNAVAFVSNDFSDPGAEETLTVTLPAGNNYCVFVGHDFNAGFTTPCNTNQDQYTVRLEGEAAPAAACCVGDSCIGDLSPADCASQSGSYVAGESCDAGYVCPIAYEPCQSGFAQDPLDPSGTWTAGTSDSTIGYFRYESIAGVPSVSSVRVYGITLFFSGSWTVCENLDMVFDLGTYNADGSGFPVTANPIAEASSVAGNQAITDLTYAGVYPLRRFDLALDSAAGDLLKINSNSADCWFLWMSSSDSTSGSSVLENGGAFELSTFDLNFCITP